MYCTQADIVEQITEDELIQLTDDAGAGSVDSDKVDRAIADADSEIDSYCGARYGVPFTTVPTMIRKVSVDIAVYHLYTRRAALGLPEERKTRYEKAVQFLRDVARGLASLGSDEPAAAADGGPEATVSKTDRIFSIGRASKGSSGSLDNY